MPLAAMLYYAACTDVLLTSVASTRSKSGARAMVKLPLPQYSSTRLPPRPVACWQAQASIWRLMPALGWVKLPLDLLVFQLAAVQFECFEHQSRPARPSGPGCGRSISHSVRRPVRGRPFSSLVQFAVVDQGNQQLAAQGGEKIDLEQPAAQGVVGYQAFRRRGMMAQIDSAAGGKVSSRIFCLGFSGSDIV